MDDRPVRFNGSLNLSLCNGYIVLLRGAKLARSVPGLLISISIVDFCSKFRFVERAEHLLPVNIVDKSYLEFSYDTVDCLPLIFE